jgi:hypothetical protein
MILSKSAFFDQFHLTFIENRYFLFEQFPTYNEHHRVYRNMSIILPAKTIFLFIFYTQNSYSLAQRIS